MAKRPPRPRQADTPAPPVPESPDRESLTDQAARLAQEWGLPDQEQQIYEVLKEGERLPEAERHLEGRGGGARIPTWPRASGHPTLDKAHTEVMRLHGLHRQLVDDVVGAFVAARKARPEGEDDPVQGLADRIFREHLPAIERQRKRAARALAALRRILTTAAPDPEKGPAAAKRAELTRLIQGLPYAMTWGLLAVHQLAPLAVAHILKLRVRPQHLGARVQIMLAAHQALDRPWGQDETGVGSLPVEEFDLAEIFKHWNELMQESIMDLQKKVRLARGFQALLLKQKQLNKEPPEVKRLALDGIVYEQVRATGLDEWGNLDWPVLERLARAGKLNVALQKIHDDLADRARRGSSRRKTRCPNCEIEGRPGTPCRGCGVRIPIPAREPVPISLDSQEEDDEKDVNVLERASFLRYEKPELAETAIEFISIELPAPDRWTELAEAVPRIKQFFKEPTLLKMLEAIGSGKKTQKEIAAYCKVTERTIRNWQDNLQKRYPDLIELSPELLQFPLPGEIPPEDQR